MLFGSWVSNYLKTHGNLAFLLEEITGKTAMRARIASWQQFIIPTVVVVVVVVVVDFGSWV